MVSLSLDTPELAASYDVVGRRQYAHGKLLVAELGIRPGHRVLDIGAGTGLLAAHVAELVGPDGRVEAIDPLPYRVELARKRAPAQLSVRVGRAEDLTDFADAHFDAVYLNSVFHWIADKATVLAGIARVLKPGGRLGITTGAGEQPHSLWQLRQRALAASGLQGRPGALLGTPYKVTREELRELLAAAGLRERELRIRTFVDHHASAHDVLEASRASSFGNHLAGLSPVERASYNTAFAAELEGARDAKGIRSERYLIFAIAEKARARV